MAIFYWLINIKSIKKSFPFNFIALIDMDGSSEKILQKIKHYCAYQERCHSEVREKLFSFDLGRKEIEAVLAQLMEEGYLDEERFALAFARGKFRMKHWGKEKIRFVLQQKQVSEYCIGKALSSIDDADYCKALESVASNKLELLKNEKNILTRKRKLRDHLLQKGYESELIAEWLKKI